MVTSEPTYGCPVVPAVEMKVGCLHLFFDYGISFHSSSFDISSVQKLQITEQIIWKHELPFILHLLESHRSPFSITTTPCCILCMLPTWFQVKSGGFFCLFFLTLCLQLPIAPGFWSLLEFLSPTRTPTGSAMFLDDHYWSNGTLLRKDYSFSSLCRCCPACAAFLQMGAVTWQKPLGGNKSWRKKSISHPSCWLIATLWDNMVCCGGACHRCLLTTLAIPALPRHSHAWGTVSR